MLDTICKALLRKENRVVTNVMTRYPQRQHQWDKGNGLSGAF